jgi:carnitine O-acetyltransferase
VVGYTTPEPTTKNVRIPPEVTKPTPASIVTDSPFPPWPQPVVTARGDYRGELFLEKDVIGGPLYSKQQELPKLPVPSLQETIATFLPTALPLARDEGEKQSLLQACESFPEQAAALQECLLNRKGESDENSSWLQQLWMDGYLTSRDPVAVLVSYFLFVPDDATLPDDQPKNVARAAAALTAMAQSRKLICSGQMPAETTGDNRPLCSTFFKYMWHACRVPHKEKDYYRLHDPSQHRHCIVAVGGRFYAVDFVDGRGEPLPLPVLRNRLQRCVDLSSAADRNSAPQMGWLTSQRRDDWARTRRELLDVGGSMMKEAFAALESAAFVLNLDEEVSKHRRSVFVFLN